jgi:hypothetical protein
VLRASHAFLAACPRSIERRLVEKLLAASSNKKAMYVPPSKLPDTLKIGAS